MFKTNYNAGREKLPNNGVSVGALNYRLRVTLLFLSIVAALEMSATASILKFVDVDKKLYDAIFPLLVSGAGVLLVAIFVAIAAFRTRTKESKPKELEKNSFKEVSQDGDEEPYTDSNAIQKTSKKGNALIYFSVIFCVYAVVSGIISSAVFYTNNISSNVVPLNFVFFIVILAVVLIIERALDRKSKNEYDEYLQDKDIVKPSAARSAAAHDPAKLDSGEGLGVEASSISNKPFIELDSMSDHLQELNEESNSNKASERKNATVEVHKNVEHEEQKQNELIAQDISVERLVVSIFDNFLIELNSMNHLSKEFNEILGLDIRAASWDIVEYDASEFGELIKKYIALNDKRLPDDKYMNSLTDCINLVSRAIQQTINPNLNRILLIDHVPLSGVSQWVNQHSLERNGKNIVFFPKPVLNLLGSDYGRFIQKEGKEEGAVGGHDYDFVSFNSEDYPDIETELRDDESLEFSGWQRQEKMDFYGERNRRDNLFANSSNSSKNCAVREDGQFVKFGELKGGSPTRLVGPEIEPPSDKPFTDIEAISLNGSQPESVVRRRKEVISGDPKSRRSLDLERFSHDPSNLDEFSSLDELPRKRSWSVQDVGKNISLMSGSLGVKDVMGVVPKVVSSENLEERHTEKHIDKRINIGMTPRGSRRVGSINERIENIDKLSGIEETFSLEGDFHPISISPDRQLKNPTLERQLIILKNQNEKYKKEGKEREKEILILKERNKNLRLIYDKNQESKELCLSKADELLELIKEIQSEVPTREEACVDTSEISYNGLSADSLEQIGKNIIELADTLEFELDNETFQMLLYPSVDTDNFFSVASNLFSDLSVALQGKKGALAHSVRLVEDVISGDDNHHIEHYDGIDYVDPGISELHHGVRTNDDSLVSTTSKLTKIPAALEMKFNSLREKESEMKTLEEALKDSIDRFDILSQSYKKLKEENLKISKRVEELEFQNEELTDNLKKTESLSGNSKLDTLNLSKQISGLVEELIGTQIKLEDVKTKSESRISSLEKRIKELENENEGLKKALETEMNEASKGFRHQHVVRAGNSFADGCDSTCLAFQQSYENAASLTEEFALKVQELIKKYINDGSPYERGGSSCSSFHEAVKSGVVVDFYEKSAALYENESYNLSSGSSSLGIVSADSRESLSLSPNRTPRSSGNFGSFEGFVDQIAESAAKVATGKFFETMKEGLLKDFKKLKDGYLPVHHEEAPNPSLSSVASSKVSLGGGNKGVR